MNSRKPGDRQKQRGKNASKVVTPSEGEQEKGAWVGDGEGRGKGEGLCEAPGLSQTTLNGK